MRLATLHRSRLPLRFRHGWAAAVLLLLSVAPSPAAEAADRKSASASPNPNIILILADDLGWADLACYGNTFNETPNIDRLAEQGLRFTQFYAGPVCSPTRANLQSGQDQARFAITQHIPGHRRPFARLIDPVVARQLPLEVDTFAEQLRDAGYATGYFGKWHLGGTGYGPANQGWQTALECNGNTAKPALTGEPQTRRMAEFLTDKAVDFIQTHSDEPFLLQVSHAAVHIPLTTTPDLLAKYQQKQPMPGYPSRPEYAGLLEELDQSVGRIAGAVRRAGIADQTLIVFVSDNGGLEHEQNGTVVTSNDPLRGEKGSLFEGGIRVPMVAVWPGRLPRGQTCDVPATTMDLYPTFLALSSASAPANQPLDGISLVRWLQDPAAASEPRALYWHLPHYHHSTPASALRQGDWKLIEFFEDGALHLYNLRRDLSETTNVAQQQPQRTQQLHSQLQRWRTAVAAQLPQPNPDYDPRRATELAKGNRRR